MPRGDQLIRQWRIIRMLSCCRFGKSISEISEAVEGNLRTVYRDLEVIQSAGFPVFTVRINGKSIWRLLPGEQSVPHNIYARSSLVSEPPASLCQNSLTP